MTFRRILWAVVFAPLGALWAAPSGCQTVPAQSGSTGISTRPKAASSLSPPFS